MSTIAAYQDRQADLLIWAGAVPGQQVQLQPQLAEPGGSGALTAGIQKLVQRFLLRLLTIRGSMRFRPDEGCAFLGQLQRGEARSSLDVYQLFSQAETDIRRQLRGEELETDPADERYGTVVIEQVGFDYGYVLLQLTITSLGGESWPYLLPVKTLP